MPKIARSFYKQLMWLICSNCQSSCCTQCRPQSTTILLVKQNASKFRSLTSKDAPILQITVTITATTTTTTTTTTNELNCPHTEAQRGELRKKMVECSTFSRNIADKPTYVFILDSLKGVRVWFPNPLITITYY